jgi:hypothetical protein
MCGQCYFRRKARRTLAEILPPRRPAPRDDGERCDGRRAWWQVAHRLLSRSWAVVMKRKRRRDGVAVAPMLAHLRRSALRVAP